MFIDAPKLIVFVILTDEKVKADLASHPDVLKECCASQPHVLHEYMCKNVSIEALKRCLAEKEGESGVQTVKLRVNRLGMEWAITTMEVFCPLNKIWFS